MDLEKVNSIIDKSNSLEDSRELIINKLSVDEDELINFLMNTDEFYFKYVLQFLDEIILKMYNKNFIKKFKENIFQRYNELSNINTNGVKTNYKKCSD